jgi:hypothetical protein
MKNEFKEKDIRYIEKVVAIARLFLEDKIDNMTVISELDLLSSDLFEYRDPNLLMFKGIWSTIDDIELEIREGKSPIKDVPDTEEDLKEYIESCEEVMKETCQKLIDEYTPILAELERRYKADA